MSEDELKKHSRSLGAKVQASQQKRKNSVAGVAAATDAVPFIIFYFFIVYIICFIRPTNLLFQRSTHFVITTSKSHYVYITSDELKTIDWISTLRANARGGYQFQSFAPLRNNIATKWYANSAEYLFCFLISLFKFL